METSVKDRSITGRVLKICGILFLLIMIIFSVYPIIYTVFGSLKTNAELTSGGSFLPKEWQFKNYYQAFVHSYDVYQPWFRYPLSDLPAVTEAWLK